MDGYHLESLTMRHYSDIGVCVTVVALNILRQLCHEDNTKVTLFYDKCPNMSLYF